MPLSTERMQVIVEDVVLRRRSSLNTKAEREFRRSIVRDIKRIGGVVEIPAEWPLAEDEDEDDDDVEVEAGDKSFSMKNCGTGSGGFKPGNTCGGSGGGGSSNVGRTWVNKDHQMASDISGVTPDEPVKTKTYYHVTKKEHVDSIMKKGLDIENVKPRWLNDLAVSVGTTAKGTMGHFQSPGKEFDSDKYELLEVKVKGRITKGSPVTWAKDAKEYTEGMVESGYDGMQLSGMTAYIHNPKSILSVKVIDPNASSKKKKWLDLLWEKNCGTGSGGFKPGNSCATGGGGAAAGGSASEGASSGGSAGSAFADVGFERVHAIFTAMDGDSPLGVAADRQMRGGVINKRGVFEEFDSKKKQANMNKLVKGLKDLKDKDPEAFEIARRLDLAERFKVESYDDIPDKVTLFRGHDDGEELPKATNVTNLRHVADNFGANGVVSEYEISKSDITFSLSNSVFNEGELIIGSTKKLNLKATHVSDAAKTKRKMDKALSTLSQGDTITFKDGRTGKLVNRGIGTSLIVEMPDGYTDYSVSFDEVTL